LASLILTHAVFVFVVGTLRALQRTDGARGKLRIAAAVMILVWFSYYFDRPDPFYLCSFYVTYGVLSIDLFRVIGAARRRPSGLWQTAFMAAFALSVVVDPRTAVDYADRRPEYRSGLARTFTAAPPPKSVSLSGWYVPDDTVADDLRIEADFIRSIARERGSVENLTENPYFIPKLSASGPTSPLRSRFRRVRARSVLMNTCDRSSTPSIPRSTSILSRRCHRRRHPLRYSIRGGSSDTSSERLPTTLNS
jgi:hypothetical protein